MDTFPKRPESHVIGDQAVQIFIKHCDPAWIVIPIEKDYGIDLRVEVTRDGLVTGEEFFVQIKGRKHIDITHEYPPRARVRQTTINYWLGKLAPTLIAMVEISTGNFSYEWLQYSYPAYPRPSNEDTNVELPLYKNTDTHSLRQEVSNYIRQYYSGIRKETQNVAHSLYLTRVLFHVAAQFRTCARAIIELQRFASDDPKDLGQLLRWFYTEFAGHDELLSSLREGRFGSGKASPNSKLLNIVTNRLAIYDVARDKFFHRYDRVESYWVIKMNYEGLQDYLLPMLGVLQELEEILFQALTLGRIVYAPQEAEDGQAD